MPASHRSAPGKGFHKILVGASHERSVQFSQAWLGGGQHNNPGVFDRFMPQTSHEFQAVFVDNPINQNQIGAPIIRKTSIAC